MSNTTTTANGTARRGKLGQRVAYACGNLGQSAFYNALSTYFVVYVTSSLFAGVDKGVATKLIGIITGLVVVIRIAEIFIDPLLGNIIDNTTTKSGPFPPMAVPRRRDFVRADRAGVHRPVRLGERQHHAVHRAVRHHLHRARRVLLPA